MRYFSHQGEGFVAEKFWIDEATDRVPMAAACRPQSVFEVWLNRQPVPAERRGHWLVLGLLREGDVVLVRYSGELTAEG